MGHNIFMRGERIDEVKVVQLIRDESEGCKRTRETLVEGKRCRDESVRHSEGLEPAGGRDSVRGGVGATHAMAKSKNAYKGCVVERTSAQRLGGAVNSQGGVSAHV
ncbi:hypothetical protein AMTR_s00028p00244320 [Amborella trichopoda]|uniref:Uncharacterized protein n=1 Tax=Amborella trichopoda TaxID=13333 RepID=W1PRN5_AMBTC|nr:hypothetical protein AMTR_s00028p00244320 [Amborella trichopoda]